MNGKVNSDLLKWFTAVTIFAVLHRKKIRDVEMMIEQRGLFSMGSNLKCGSHYFLLRPTIRTKEEGGLRLHLHIQHKMGWKYNYPVKKRIWSVKQHKLKEIEIWRVAICLYFLDDVDAGGERQVNIRFWDTLVVVTRFETYLR